MARPTTTDWAALDLVTDPTPGDPDDLERLAAAYVTLATNTATGRDLMSGEGTVVDARGAAMREFNVRLGTLPQRLTVAADSSATAATALRRYADVLRGCQQRADRALWEGQQLHAVLAQRQEELDALRAVPVQPTLGYPADDQRALDIARVQRLVDEVRAELADVRQRALGAFEDRLVALDATVLLLGQAAELVDPPPTANKPVVPGN